MIFNIPNHIEQIKSGTKTQTRRRSDKYKVGNFYTIQPKRGVKGIPEGKIFIHSKHIEVKSPLMMTWYILPDEAIAEGGYNPESYEELYEKMYPNWVERWCYLFRYYSMEDVEKLNTIFKERGYI